MFWTMQIFVRNRTSNNLQTSKDCCSLLSQSGSYLFFLFLLFPPNLAPTSCSPAVIHYQMDHLSLHFAPVIPLCNEWEKRGASIRDQGTPVSFQRAVDKSKNQWHSAEVLMVCLHLFIYLILLKTQTSTTMSATEYTIQLCLQNTRQYKHLKSNTFAT